MSAACLLVVGSCNRPTPYFASANGSGISVFEFDADTLEATPVCEYRDIDNPTFLSVRPDGRALYATSEIFGWKEGLVTAFAFDAAGRQLEYLNAQPTLGSIAAQSTVSRDMRHLLLVNYGMGSGGPDQSLVTYLFTGDKGLSPATSYVRHAGSGRDPSRQERSHAHSVTEVAPNLFVVADLGLDTLTTYRLADDGALTRLSETRCAPGSGPRHVAVHPGGTFLFVMNELNSTCAGFSIDAETGVLSAINAVSALPQTSDVDNHCADIQISPDGRFLYGSNRGHDSISIYAVDQDSGTIALAGVTPCGGKTPRNLAMSPSGDHLFCANQDTDGIAIFQRDAETGSLDLCETNIPVGTPTCIRIMSA